MIIIECFWDYFKNVANVLLRLFVGTSNLVKPEAIVVMGIGNGLKPYLQANLRSEVQVPTHMHFPKLCDIVIF